MIRAGTLTKRIQFLEDQAARTASGAPGPADWQPVSSTWHAAAIQPHTGAERIVAGQREATVTHRIKLRYAAGVTAGMRVRERYTEATFEILAVLDYDFAHRELALKVEQLAPEGS